MLGLEIFLILEIIFIKIVKIDIDDIISKYPSGFYDNKKIIVYNL